MQNLFSRLARGEALVRIVEAHRYGDVHEGLLLVRERCPAVFHLGAAGDFFFAQPRRVEDARTFFPGLGPRYRGTGLGARLRRRGVLLAGVEVRQRRRPPLAGFKVSMPVVRPRLAPTANAASMMNFDISM